MKLNLCLTNLPPFSHVTFCLAFPRFITFFLGLSRMTRERILLMFVRSGSSSNNESRRLSRGHTRFSTFEHLSYSVDSALILFSPTCINVRGAVTDPGFPSEVGSL